MKRFSPATWALIFVLGFIGLYGGYKGIKEIGLMNQDLTFLRALRVQYEIRANAQRAQQLQLQQQLLPQLNNQKPSQPLPIPDKTNDK